MSRDRRGGARLRAARAVLLGATLLAGTACGSRARPRGHAVSIRSFQFAPAALEVAVGDTVTWTNHDFVPHTATASDGSFDTRSIGTEASASVVIRRRGQTTYRCTFHPAMTGSVTTP